MNEDLTTLAADLAQAARVAERTRAASEEIDAVPGVELAAWWPAWRVYVEAELARYDLQLRFTAATRWQKGRAA